MQRERHVNNSDLDKEAAGTQRLHTQTQTDDWNLFILAKTFSKMISIKSLSLK